MSASTLRGGFPELLKREAYKWYWEEYDKNDPVWPQVFETVNTSAAYEKSTSGVGTGLLIEKTENEALDEATPIEGYTVYGKVRDWGKVEAISRDMRDDPEKLKGFLKSQMPMWATDAVETMETFYANVFNYGGYTAGHDMFNATITNVVTDASGDGVYDGTTASPIPLFNLSDNTRASKNGSTYYNGLALAVTKGNLQTAYDLMTITNAYKEDGTRMRMQPETILAPYNLKWTIDELLDSQDDPTTANRATNVMKGIVNPIYWRYLTDTNAWFLMKKKFGLKALVHTNPEFDMWEDKRSKTYYMSIFMRFGLMIDNYRGLVGSNFSTS